MATKKPVKKAVGGTPMPIKPTVNTPSKPTTVGPTQVPSWVKDLPSTPVTKKPAPAPAPTRTVTAVNNTRGNVLPNGKAKTVMMAKKGGPAMKKPMTRKSSGRSR